MELKEISIFLAAFAKRNSCRELRRDKKQEISLFFQDFIVSLLILLFASSLQISYQTKATKLLDIKKQTSPEIVLSKFNSCSFFFHF